ncbi:protein KRI1 homolog [Hetaerina americana]|uniref:protein KRI1 homolog n=1 Tax=Hetaerina americana TaxID=62018 RepID=UPI003A7F2DB7
MARPLEGSDDELEVKFNINKNYAEKYDNWRRKEELQKFKDRYGKDALERCEEESSSSSSDDDFDSMGVPQEFDKEFYHTLSCLKSRDPKIYDKSMKFFENVDFVRKGSGNKTESKPMFLRDYERKVIQEGGILSDEDEEPEERVRDTDQAPSYFEEQDAIKKSFKEVLHTEGDDCKEGIGIGGLFSKKVKSHQELEKEEDEYAAWLLGNKEELKDVDEENKLSHLRSYWNDPTLDPEEVFLRDYILQKKFQPGVKKGKVHVIEKEEDENSSSGESAPNGELLEQEEAEIEAMEEFEHKFNFRFEEPDQEFIKRYPRTLDHSLRKKDDKRKQKRDELRTRKEIEKQKLKEELGKAKELKQKEIEERLKQICSITGNADLGFKGDDLNDDFDPEEHDKRMKEIFSDDAFYATEENVKPVFPGMDEELDIEEWDNWGVDETHGDGSVDQNYPHSSGAVDNGLHSEDPNFNMDCEYDPKKLFQQEMLTACQKKSKCEKGKGRRWRARQSRLAMGLMKKKPQFDPIAVLSKAKLCKGDVATAFEKYVDEYYGLEYEDIIGGDLPCRFKYRKVIPNDFGLSVEEILSADDKELNRWCTLKKTVQIRPEENEKYDLQAYRKKSSNLNLKKKVFRSLYSSPEEENGEDSAKVKFKKGKRKEVVAEEPSLSQADDSGALERGEYDDAMAVGEVGEEEEHPVEGTSKKKKRKKRKRDEGGRVKAAPQEDQGNEKSIDGKAVREEIKDPECEGKERLNVKEAIVNEGKGEKKSRKTKDVNSHKRKKNETGIKDGKIKKQHDPTNYLSALSKSRLKAYGINPKKFGNKLKYKQSV